MCATLVVVVRQLSPLQGKPGDGRPRLWRWHPGDPDAACLNRAVDRRFNRTRTDAARTLSEFTDTERSGSEPDTVAAELHSAVERTFQPERLSVWVRSA